MIFGFGKKNITINGMPMTTRKRSYSYEWVCEVEYGDPNAYKWCPSISYQYADKTHGILRPGRSIKIKDGMHFNVAVTGSA